MRRGAQLSWLPFGYWFSIDPRTFAGERRQLEMTTWNLRYAEP